jgi:hypothetical protein
MYDVSAMYWETYADQSEDEGFTLIGVGEDIIEIENIEEHVKEFRRRYGRRCEIKLYR